MSFKPWGLKAWLIFIAVLLGVFIIVGLVLGFLVFLLPIILIIIALSVFFHLFTRHKKLKAEKSYVDVKVKVKK